MVSNPAKWGSVAAVMFGSLALALLAFAAQVSPPNFGTSDSERQPPILAPAEIDQYIGFYVRGANTVYSITRDGERMLLHVSGAPLMELVADSEMNFRIKSRTSEGPPTTFVRDVHGQIRALIVHFETFSVPMARIDASAAQAIVANNDVKLRSQTATPGSEAALRRLLDGLRTHKPDYDEMAPWLAELVKETTALNEPYVRWGALQSITFTRVDGFGGDEYIVRQEGGVSTWTIWLDSAGTIQDVDNYRMSD